MNQCPNCNSEVKEEYKFCPYCSKPLKCPNCGEDIGSGFAVCAYCGTNLLPKENNNVLNEYSFLEEREGANYKRSVKLKATNDAVEKLGGLIISNSQPILGALPRKNPSPITETIPQGENLLLPPSTDDKEETPIQSIIDNIDPYEKIKDYIFPLDGKLQVILDDFRGNSNADNQRRYILLFVGGFQYHFQNQVPIRSQLIERSKSLEIWNTNFSKEITNLGKTYLIESDDGLRLSPKGKQEAGKIIDEIVNPNEESSNTNSPKGRKANRTKTKSGTEKEQKTNEWINSMGELRNFDVRILQKSINRQKLQFGLWILLSGKHYLTRKGVTVRWSPFLRLSIALPDL